jgi:hypothetical protein
MQFHRRTSIFLHLPILLIVSACATNALRVEYAGNVAAQGKAAGLAARTFLGNVDLARQDLAIDLISADPACGRPGNAAVVRHAPNLASNHPQSGWICVSHSDSPGPGNLQLGPIADALEPTLVLIDALVSYSDALAEIVAPNPIPPEQEINDALGLASSMQGLWQALSGTQTGPLTEERQGAISGFITMMEELKRERDQVRHLREVIRRHPDGAQPLIRELREDLLIWETSRKGDAAVRNIVVASLARDVLDRTPPVSIGDRRQALSSFYSRRRAANEANALHPALDAVLVSLDQADRDLRRVLVENPNLTREERARVSEIARRRITRALQRLTALITAFGGV